MAHLTEDTLRAYLDNELESSDHAGAERHLAGCADCRAAQHALATRVARVQTRLAVLAPERLEAPRPAANALAQFKSKEKVTMFQSLFSKKLRPGWAGLTFVALVAASFSFAPVRVWAGEFLGLFRVEQVKVLPIDLSQLETMTGNETLAQNLSRLIADSVTVTRKEQPPRLVADAAAAGQAASFTVRLPANRADMPQLTVAPGAAFQFTVNRERAQTLLDEAGRSDLRLPASLDKAVIAVDIPATVAAAYGECPALEKEASPEASRVNPDEPAAYAERYPTCVVVAEIPSPSVTTPPDVNMRELAEIGLQLMGMKAAEAQEFSRTVDWATTLVVPLPQNAARYETVQVDGVTGYLIQSSAKAYDPGYALIWVKDGIIYTVSGAQTDPTAGLALANSLK